MKVAMMQPTFLPWQGYFELICRVDKFIFLDDFQFSRQSFHQRNRLFVGRNQVAWYTVPIKIRKSLGKPLNKVLIDENGNWRKKMQKRIKQTYAKAPFFDIIWPPVENWLNRRYNFLADYNIAFILLVSEMLNIDTEFLNSSSIPTQSHRSERILEILRTVDADIYRATHGAFGYMKEDGIFPVKDIEVFFQNYIQSPYPQIPSDKFVPYLSVLDALFHIGCEATADIVKTGTAEWLSWEKMTMLKSEKTE